MISKQEPVENKSDVQRFILIVVRNSTSAFSLCISIEFLSCANTIFPTYLGHNVEVSLLLDVNVV